MAEQSYVPEILEYPKEEFAQHLGLEYNHRILFSGRFGIGKTTFLKYFFEESKYKDEYNAVHLFPVNYQVSENKDIFEYIKYDILAHLLSVDDIELEKVNIPAIQTVPYLLLQKPADLIAPLLHFFGGAGKAYENYRELINKVYKEHEAIQIDEKEELLNYLKPAEQQKGSIYENDFYTNLIVTLLQRWKSATHDTSTQGGADNTESEKTGRQNVLIVDDLDRIDPQHAFRLFNLFAAHFDLHEEQKNKFGFDKVVFVCDAQNIRNIFAHNYGSEVDFSGYIDKFFSTRIYPFDNTEAVANIVKATIENSDYSLKSFFYNLSKKGLNSVLEFMLNVLLRAGALNLRSLFKLPASNQMKHHSKDYILDSVKRQSGYFLAVALVDILAQLVGSPEALYGALKKCEQYIQENKDYMRNYNSRFMSGDVIAFLGYKHDEGQAEHEYNVEDENLVISYKMGEPNSSSAEYGIKATIIRVIDTEGNEIGDKSEPNVFLMYQKLVDSLTKRGHW